MGPGDQAPVSVGGGKSICSERARAGMRSWSTGIVSLHGELCGLAPLALVLVCSKREV